jgi:hypothetical protein
MSEPPPMEILQPFNKLFKVELGKRKIETASVEYVIEKLSIFRNFKD